MEVISPPDDGGAKFRGVSSIESRSRSLTLVLPAVPQLATFAVTPDLITLLLLLQLTSSLFHHVIVQARDEVRS